MLKMLAPKLDAGLEIAYEMLNEIPLEEGERKAVMLAYPDDKQKVILLLLVVVNDNMMPIRKIWDEPKKLDDAIKDLLKMAKKAK